MSVANIKLQTPHPAQEEILKSKAKRIVINSGRQFGKTSLMINVAIKHMLEAKFKNNKKPSVLYVTPTNSLGVDVFKELLTYLPDELINEVNHTRLYLKLFNGSTFRIISAESGAVAFRGKRHSLCICDEFAHYKSAKSLFLEGIEPTLLSYDGGRVYFISTPLGQNYFFDLFNRGKDKLNKGWESFHFTSYDNPYLSKSYIDSKREEMGELPFCQEMLGEFASNAANPFGLNIKKNIISSLANGRPDSIGIDLAKTLDFSVVIGVKENKDNASVEMCLFNRWQGVDWNITKEKIKLLPRSVEKLMDSTGVGDPILDDLKLSVANIKGFKFSKATKGNLIRELIKSVETGKIKYTEEVANEMEVFQYSYNSSTGYLSYSAQEGYHDDMVIALALAWWQYNRRTRTSSNWCIGTA